MRAETERKAEEISHFSMKELKDFALSQYERTVKAQQQLSELQAIQKEMVLQASQLMDKVRGLDAENKELKKLVEKLTHDYKVHTKELYGTSSETASSLNGQENTDNPVDEDEPDEKTDTRKLTPRVFSQTVKKRRKAKRKKTDLIKDLPVQKAFQCDVEELDRKYGRNNWRLIRWAVHDTVESIPAQLYVKRVFTPVISTGLEHMAVSVPYDPPLFPGSLASVSLLSDMGDYSFDQFIPMYRQENYWAGLHFPVSRQTMSNWIINASETYLSAVFGYLKTYVRDSEYQQCDETTFAVLHDERKAGKKGYIWVHRTGELSELPQAVVLCYEPSRSADHLREFYKELDHHVYLTSDCYAAYATIEKELPDLVEDTACHMHSRRRWVVAFNAAGIEGFDPSPKDREHERPENKVIRLYRAIYAADEAFKDNTAEQRLKNRKETVKPLVDEYFRYLKTLDLNNPAYSMEMIDAVQYSLNHEEGLRKFLDDGYIPIDDGATERECRAAARYRCVSLFANTVRGAESACTYMSLIETAKANHANPRLYLEYLMTEIPKHRYDKDDSYLKDMVPWSQKYRLFELETTGKWKSFLHFEEPEPPIRKKRVTEINSDQKQTQTSP